MLAAGKYTAKAVSGKFGVSQEKKTPCIAVRFEVTLDNGKKEYVSWRGWLSPNALERTMQSLAIMGFDENKNPAKDGSIDQTYFNGTEVEVSVDVETYQDKNSGEERSRSVVAFVNMLGGGKFGLADTTVTEVLRGIDLRKEIMVARQKLGIKKSASLPRDLTPDFNSHEEIPF